MLGDVCCVQSFIHSCRTSHIMKTHEMGGPDEQLGLSPTVRAYSRISIAVKITLRLLLRLVTGWRLPSSLYRSFPYTLLKLSSALTYFRTPLSNQEHWGSCSALEALKAFKIGSDCARDFLRILRNIFNNTLIQARRDKYG